MEGCGMAREEEILKLRRTIRICLGVFIVAWC